MWDLILAPACLQLCKSTGTSVSWTDWAKSSYHLFLCHTWLLWSACLLSGCPGKCHIILSMSGNLDKICDDGTINYFCQLGYFLNMFELFAFYLTLSLPITTKVPYANSLDLDKSLSNSVPHLDPSCLTLRQHFHQFWALLKHFENWSR